MGKGCIIMMLLFITKEKLIPAIFSKVHNFAVKKLDLGFGINIVLINCFLINLLYLCFLFKWQGDCHII